jgi:hypothetical protein
MKVGNVPRRNLPFLAAVLALCACLLLLGLFRLERYLGGRRAWRAWKAAQEAAGMDFDPASCLPPAVPDPRNFAAAPILAANPRRTRRWSSALADLPTPGMGDWQSGLPEDFSAVDVVLRDQDPELSLAPFAADLEALADAARRPASQLQLADGSRQPAPEFSERLLALGRLLQRRALVRLHAGRPVPALEDVLTALAVARHLQDEPYPPVQLARLFWLDMFMQPIWEGLASRAWDEPRLARLEAALEPQDLVASFALAQRYRRCLDSASLEAKPPIARSAHWQDWATARWLSGVYRSKYGAALRQDQDRARIQAALAAPRIRLDRLDLTPPSGSGGRKPAFLHPAAAAARFPSGFLPRLARVQAGLDQAMVVCALERWRLRHGRYPRDLQELVPAYRSALPQDRLMGGLLAYASTGRTFHLAAAGWPWRREQDQAQAEAGDPSEAPAGGNDGPQPWPWAAWPVTPRRPPGAAPRPTRDFSQPGFLLERL